MSEEHRLVCAPFRVVFAKCGGYNCMTSSYDVYDANNKIVCELDSALFGQCKGAEDRECLAACTMAQHVADALNFFHANINTMNDELLKKYKHKAEYCGFVFDDLLAVAKTMKSLEIDNVDYLRLMLDKNETFFTHFLSENSPVAAPREADDT